MHGLAIVSRLPGFYLISDSTNEQPSVDCAHSLSASKMADYETLDPGTFAKALLDLAKVATCIETLDSAHSIVDDACRTLFSCIELHPLLARRFCDDGGLSALSSLIHREAALAPLVVPSLLLRVLCMLSASGGSSVMMGAEAVVFHLRRTLGDPDELAYVLEMFDPDIEGPPEMPAHVARALIGQGAAAALMAVLDSHAGDAGLVTASVRALHNLLDSLPSEELASCRIDGLSALLAAARAVLHIHEFEQAFFALLFLLCDNADNRSALLACGALDLLLEQGDTHRDCIDMAIGSLQAACMLVGEFEGASAVGGGSATPAEVLRQAKAVVKRAADNVNRIINVDRHMAAAAVAEGAVPALCNATRLTAGRKAGDAAVDKALLGALAACLLAPTRSASELTLATTTAERLTRAYLDSNEDDEITLGGFVALTCICEKPDAVPRALRALKNVEQLSIDGVKRVTRTGNLRLAFGVYRFIVGIAECSNVVKRLVGARLIDDIADVGSCNIDSNAGVARNAMMILNYAGFQSDAGKDVLRQPKRLQLIVDYLKRYGEEHGAASVCGLLAIHAATGNRKAAKALLSMGYIEAAFEKLDHVLDNDEPAFTLLKAVNTIMNEAQHLGGKAPKLTACSKSGAAAGAPAAGGRSGGSGSDGASAACSSPGPDIAVMVKVLQTQPTDLYITQQVAAASIFLACDNKDNAAALLAGGIAGALGDAMRIHIEDKETVQNSLRALVFIAGAVGSSGAGSAVGGAGSGGSSAVGGAGSGKASGNPSASGFESHPLPTDFGAAVGAALTRHAADGTTLDLGLQLVQLCQHDDAFCVDFCGSGGAKLLSAGTTFVGGAGSLTGPGAAGMAKRLIAVGRLQAHMLRVRGTSRHFMQTGMGVRSIAALRKIASSGASSSDPQAFNLCANLGMLSEHDDAVCEELARMGAGEAVVALLGPSGEAAEARASYEAVRVLRNVAASAAARPKLMACGAPATLIGALNKLLALKPESPAAHAELCQLGCGALRNLAASPENRAVLMAAGACSIGIKVLRSSSSAEAEVTWAACGLLMALASEPCSCEAMLRADAASELITAMRRFPADTRIGWAVAGVLLKLAEACVAATAHSVASGGASTAAAGGAADGALAGGDVASYLPLLEEGAAVALTLHGAADARIARTAVSAVKQLKAAAAARGAEVSAALLDAVRATVVAHKSTVTAAAASGAGGVSGGSDQQPSAGVVTLCRAVLGL